MTDPTRIYIARNVEDYQGTPLDGQVMQWNSSGSYWEPSNVPLDELEDVIISTPQPGDMLKYTGSYWINTGNLGKLNDLVNVNITSPATKAVLLYSSGSWIDGGLNLNDLLDVVCSSPIEGMGIFWDGANWTATLGSSGSTAAQLLHVFNDNISGTGSDFDTTYEYVTGTLRVTWNGVRQSNSYFSERPARDGFTTEFIVQTGDSLIADYARPTSGSVGSVGNANAVTIQGRAVSPQAPTDGQVMTWSSGSNWWYPATP
jgi:hypothetical protein